MELYRKKHIRYFVRCLTTIHKDASSLDANRLMFVFFAVSGLDIMGALDELSEEKKKEICNGIYYLKIAPDQRGEIDSQDDDTKAPWGFQGTSILLGKPRVIGVDHSIPYICSHIGMTYTGIASLLILGDDLSQLDRKSVIRGIRACQQPDGSYSGSVLGIECDMRFVYCAAAVCYMLQDWDGMDKELTNNYILNSLSYDFGFGAGPGYESHGGYTFCAIASLAMMGSLTTVLTEKQLDRIRRWCLNRQSSGFEGRPNKPVDSCYSFWIGATLEILGCYDLIDKKENREFVLSTQDFIIGGFGKWPDADNDPLHSYFALSGLCLMKEEDCLPVNPELNFSKRAVEYMHKLHEKWKQQS